MEIVQQKGEVFVTVAILELEICVERIQGNSHHYAQFGKKLLLLSLCVVYLFILYFDKINTIFCLYNNGLNEAWYWLHGIDYMWKYNFLHKNLAKKILPISISIGTT